MKSTAERPSARRAPELKSRVHSITARANTAAVGIRSNLMRLDQLRMRHPKAMVGVRPLPYIGSDSSRLEL